MKFDISRLIGFSKYTYEYVQEQLQPPCSAPTSVSWCLYFKSSFTSWYCSVLSREVYLTREISTHLSSVPLKVVFLSLLFIYVQVMSLASETRQEEIHDCQTGRRRFQTARQAIQEVPDWQVGKRRFQTVRQAGSKLPDRQEEFSDCQADRRRFQTALQAKGGSSGFEKFKTTIQENYTFKCMYPSRLQI